MIIAKVELTKKNQIKFVSLVKKPAVELDFLKMQHDCATDDREIIDERLTKLFLEHLKLVGESEEKLFSEGWIVDDELKMAIESDPNLPSMMDTDKKLIRYVYKVLPGKGAPIIPTTRDFCREVVNLNLVYRKEDINQMSFRSENEEFGTYSIWKYKGSYGCRHYWDIRVYSKNKVFMEKELKLSFNEDKQDIVGPVLIPDKHYYRSAKFFGGKDDGYIFFTKDTVKQIAIDFLNNTDNSFNLDHDNDKIVSKDDISLVESWIVESEKDKAYELGFTKEQIPIGTWMMKQHINSAEIWNDVKDGKYNGFSIQGYPTINIIASSVDMQKEMELDRIANEIVEIIKNHKK